MLKEKIIKQIEDIRDITLFKALHYRGHALEKHVLSEEQLQRAFSKKVTPTNDIDIVMVTRFFSEKEAVDLIADTLLKNVKEIEKWLLSDTEGDYVAYGTFDAVTGDGFAKNTACDHTIPLHNVCVVVRKDFSCICKSFVVVTAYPSTSLDDVDVVYELIDEYIEKRCANA